MKRVETELDKLTRQLRSMRKENPAFELLRQFNKPAIPTPVSPIRVFPQYHPDLLRGKRLFGQIRPKPTQLEQLAELIRNPPMRREVFVNNPYGILF